MGCLKSRGYTLGIDAGSGTGLFSVILTINGVMIRRCSDIGEILKVFRAHGPRVGTAI